MDDLISRQAVLEATSTTLKITGKENAETVYAYIKKLCDDIKALPSAQQWIPCSERVDIPNHEVLMCDKRGEMIIGYLAYHDEQWIGESETEFMYDPIAWMPLPEPWRGENE